MVELYDHRLTCMNMCLKPEHSTPPSARCSRMASSGVAGYRRLCGILWLRFLWCPGYAVWPQGSTLLSWLLHWRLHWLCLREGTISLCGELLSETWHMIHAAATWHWKQMCYGQEFCWTNSRSSSIRKMWTQLPCADEHLILLPKCLDYRE